MAGSSTTWSSSLPTENLAQSKHFFQVPYLLSRYDAPGKLKPFNPSINNTNLRQIMDIHPDFRDEVLQTVDFIPPILYWWNSVSICMYTRLSLHTLLLDNCLELQALECFTNPVKSFIWPNLLNPTYKIHGMRSHAQEIPNICSKGAFVDYFSTENAIGTFVEQRMN